MLRASQAQKIQNDYTYIFKHVSVFYDVMPCNVEINAVDSLK